MSWYVNWYMLRNKKVCHRLQLMWVQIVVSWSLSFTFAPWSSSSTKPKPSLFSTTQRERERDGAWKDWDQEDRERNQQTGDLLKEKEWDFQESPRALCSMWCQSLRHHVFCLPKIPRVHQSLHLVCYALFIYYISWLISYTGTLLSRSIEIHHLNLIHKEKKIENAGII